MILTQGTKTKTLQEGTGLPIETLLKKTKTCVFREK